VVSALKSGAISFKRIDIVLIFKGFES